MRVFPEKLKWNLVYSLVMAYLTDDFSLNIETAKTRMRMIKMLKLNKEIRVTEVSIAIVVAKNDVRKVAISKEKIGDILTDGGISKLSKEFMIFEYHAFDNDVVEKVTSILRGSVTDKVKLLRAYISDEYGTEYFLLIRKGSVKVYQFDDGEESEDVVAAYDMWHEGLGDIWYGFNDRDVIEEMREDYGSFDAEGAKYNLEEVDLTDCVSSKEKFENIKLDIPHASKKWLSHLNVFEKNAFNAAVNGSFPPDENSFKYVRTYKLAGRIGYAFSWECEGKEIVFLQEVLDECGATLGTVVNHARYDIEHIIVMFDQVDWISDDIKNDKKWFVWDLPDSVMPIVGQDL